MKICYRSTQLAVENEIFAGTGGVSEKNRHDNFSPAFQDIRTGYIEISRFKDGTPSPFHLLDGLPPDWIFLWDLHGHACQLKRNIVSGFVRCNVFYDRQQAADYIQRSASVIV